MENCGSCKFYVNNKVSGPSCSKNGKAVSYLMQKDCFVPMSAEDAPDVVTKVCNRCHRSLPITEFSRKSSTKDGYQFQCKECQQAMARDLYEKRKAEQKKAQEEKPETIPETKVCRKCGRELPVSMFGKAPKNQYGLKSYCRDCENENCRKYRAKKYGRQGKPNPKPKKEKPPKVTEPVITPKPIPFTELTFEKFMQSFMAYGSLTIKVTISTPQNDE